VAEAAQDLARRLTVGPEDLAHPAVGPGLAARGLDEDQAIRAGQLAPVLALADPGALDRRRSALTYEYRRQVSPRRSGIALEARTRASRHDWSGGSGITCQVCC
jgi:hypothetical protein